MAKASVLNGQLMVYVAEDDEDDRLLFQDALADAASQDVPVTFAKDGVELLELLDKNQQERRLVVLDLNMPRMDGREVLRTLRKSSDGSNLPVVVLSTSDSASDIEEAYKLGANTYFTKPARYRDLVGLVETLVEYWQGWAQLPKGREGSTPSH